MKPLKELERYGYCFQLEGDRIRFKHRGTDKPDPEIVKPLLAELKQRKQEVVKYLQAREKLRRKVIPFPYPINETLKIGEYDPLDIRYVNGKPVVDPGWWKQLREKEK